ncbi:MAG: hypothetical protein AAF202_08360, partial [Pseudomonadota bacterium]
KRLNKMRWNAILVLLLSALVSSSAFSDANISTLVTTAAAVTSVDLTGQQEFAATIAKRSPGLYQAKLNIPGFLVDRIDYSKSAELILPFANKRMLSVKIKKGSTGPTLLFRYPHSALIGMEISAKVSIQTTGLFLVPIQAIFTPVGDKQFVFVVREGLARKVEVSPWKFESSQLLTHGPLKKGDKVITAKLNQITDNQPIQVKP